MDSRYAAVQQFLVVNGAPIFLRREVHPRVIAQLIRTVIFMYKFPSLLIALLLCVSPAANAQLTVDQLPNIRVLGAVDMTLTQFGGTVAANAKVGATLKNAQAILDAFIPSINKRLACGKKDSKVGIEILSLSAAPTVGVALDAPFVIQAEANVKDCSSSELYGGSISIAVPIGVAVSSNQRTITLRPGPVELRNQGIVLVNFLRAPDLFVSYTVKKKATPEIGKVAKSFEQKINNMLQTAAVQKQFDLYKVAIRSPQVSYRYGDLAVEVEVTGQVAAKTANAWLARLTD
ncbi:MAG: hypothetical protein AB1490_11385 [Pseudomonadota bacterium]